MGEHPRAAERRARRAREQGLRRAREARARRRARLVGGAGFAAALALPALLWHDVVGEIAGEFRVDPTYLVTGWSPWVLMALGLLCCVNAAVLDLRNRSGRFYGSPTGPWIGWGVTLYVLGFGLATQVAQIAGGVSSV